MGPLSWLSRLKQSKGHGVHSPFAFDLITKVIHSPHAFYAFYDIPNLLKQKGLNPGIITPFHHLSFRLVHHFVATRILEINSENGVNTLFLKRARPEAQCTCVEKDPASLSVARMLHEDHQENPRFVPVIPEPGEDVFDALILQVDKETVPTIDHLLGLGHENSFWLIHSIREGAGKLLWREIVKDERIRATFALKETGIAFPWPSLTPSSYTV